MGVGDRRGRLRAVFFDVDNTLYDFDASVTAAMAQVRRVHWDAVGHVDHQDLERLYMATSEAATKEHKLALMKEDVWKYRRYLWQGVLDRLEARGTPATGKRDDLAGDLAKAFAEFRFGTLTSHAYPGALEAVRAAAEKYRVGIITNGPPELQRAKLHALGIHDFFEPGLVFVSGEFGEDKPSPNLFNAAAKAAGFDPDACAMVGDNLECDIGCRAIGMYAILFHPKETAPVLDGCRHPPDHVARSWREIRDHLAF